MTGAPIDGSIRRAVLTDESTGNIVSDSRKKLDDAPVAIMEPGTEQVSLNFTDKKGLTDDYGNVYVGYGNAGGSSFTVSSDQPETIDSEADDANDGDILVFVDVEGKYLPFAYEAVGLPRVSIIDTPNNLDVLQFDTALQVYLPKTLFQAGIPKVSGGIPIDLDVLVYDQANGYYEPTGLVGTFNLVQTDGTAPVEGDVLVYKVATQSWSPGPQIMTEWIQFIIEKPQNRSYRFSESLPYDITITGTTGLIESGPGTISFPAGTIPAGTPAQITVTGTTNQSAFLRAQIRFTRNLNIV